jgi:hypothetical protein
MPRAEVVETPDPLRPIGHSTEPCGSSIRSINGKAVDSW